MDAATRKRLYNDCKPNQALEPNDGRNLDIDMLGSDETRVRGANWVDELSSRIENDNGPVCELFTGLPGSGKSTELLRLIGRLSREDGPHLFPVRINVEKLLDLTSPIDAPEVLITILDQTEQAVLREEGKDPASALDAGYLRRFWDVLTRTDVEAKKVELGYGGVKASFDIKYNPTLRDRIRQLVMERPEAFLAEVREELEKNHQERVRRLGYSGLVVIVDSLEKLSGLTTNWDEVLDSAERLFAQGAPKLRLPVHVIYTIPPALALRLTVPVLYMPMIKLRSRDGSDFPEGLAAARELVRRRIPDPLLHELLTEDQVQRLVRWSGGFPREIMRLLQTVLLKKTMSETLFRRALVEVGDEIRRTIPRSASGWLARIAVERPISIIDGEEQRALADQMLSNNVVLRYRNDEEWFDVHPAVQDLPDIVEAKARILALKQAPPAAVPDSPAKTD